MTKKPRYEELEQRINELQEKLVECNQALTSLRKSEEHCRTLVNEINDGIFVTDTLGRFTFVNKTLATMYGHEHAEVLFGKNFLDFVSPEKRDEVNHRFRRAVQDGEFTGETTGVSTVRKDGRAIFIDLKAVPVTEEGSIVGTKGVIRDVTERRRAEEEKKKLQARLLQAQKLEAIATLAGGIAHQFNNALSGITGTIDLLQMALPNDKHTRKHIEVMKGFAQRIATLTNQLLAYARGGKYKAQVISLRGCVRDTLPLIERTLKDSIRIETHFRQNLLSIQADLTQMQMVISTILKNSSEAIDGEGLIRISATNEEFDEEFKQSHPGLKPGRFVCLSIKDNGKGMDEETRSRIFEPFFSTKFQGRGLGMAAIYGIVKSHDGSISVDSELGKGTTVRIYLPAIENKDKQP